MYITGVASVFIDVVCSEAGRVALKEGPQFLDDQMCNRLAKIICDHAGERVDVKLSIGHFPNEDLIYNSGLNSNPLVVTDIPLSFAQMQVT